MGNYNNLIKRPHINFIPAKHQFETEHVQRIKETPFSYAEPFSVDPPIFIDPIDIRMRELVTPRVSRNQFFPPSEIVKIITNVVAGLNQLEEHGFVAHGDLSFDTIYYDKRHKLFKISHPLFSPQSGYELSKQGKRFSILSPQQLVNLTDPQFRGSNIMSIKSDMFILGILMLQVCTLIPSSEIYCPDTYIIFDKQIQNRIQLIKQYYQSQPLCSNIIKIINQLLEYDENKRRGSKQILWQLQNLEPSRNMQPQQPVMMSQGPMPMSMPARHELMGNNFVRR